MTISIQAIARQGRSLVSSFLRSLPIDSLTIGPPKRIVGKASAWYESLSSTERQIHAFHMLAPEQAVERRLPSYADPPISKLFEQMQSAHVAEQFVVEIAGGRYWGRAYGYIVAPGDTVLADISPVFNRYGMPVADLQTHDALQQFRLPPLVTIKATVLNINTMFCGNFHHFLLDTLPKISLVLKTGIRLSEIDHIIFDYNGSPYQKEALHRLGIAEGKILRSSSDTHIRASRLIVPSYSEPGARVASYHYTAEGMEFVRRLFLLEAPERKRRILLSRRLARTRRWIQEDAALSELNKLGFERFELEKLSVAVQASLFSQSEIVLMPHGGGLANCVFCPPGAKVLELFNSSYLPTFMMSLSDRLNLEYHALVGASREIAGGGIEADIDIPHERIIEYLKKII